MTDSANRLSPGTSGRDASSQSLGFDANEMALIRSQFPILERTVRGGAPLIYLDSAATAQRAAAAVSASNDFAQNQNSAVHRGAHALAEQATELFEAARQKVATFFGANNDQVVFTTGVTGAINLLTWSLAKSGRIKPGDRLVVTEAEHHSNLVPWQQLALATGAELAWLRVGEDGQLDLNGIDQIIKPNTKVVAFGHASNVTGAVADVASLVSAAGAVGAWTVLDAAQTAPHLPFSFTALGVDFAAISSHKMYGPTGVGALIGRQERLEALPPGPTGGSMVEIVTMSEATFMPPPARFEAGTPPFAQAIGWAATIEWLAGLGLERVAAHEAALTGRLLAGLADLPGVRVLGPLGLDNRLGVVSLEIKGVHPHDAGQYLDAAGIAVRVGHHCAQPVHRALGVSASTRASLAVHTSPAEIDRFLEVLAQVRPYFLGGF
ncbi:MAG: SufS family cysteine desulfurase [Micrococcales bacterium]|nr:SufS family cysteine desulfurase [Micrococcales bacterium]